MGGTLIARYCIFNIIWNIEYKNRMRNVIKRIYGEKIHCKNKKAGFFRYIAKMKK